MGGGEAVTLASDPLYADLTPQIRGWILESPFIDFTPKSKPNGVTVFFGRLGAKVLPNHQLYQPIPPEDVTRDPAVVKSLTDDPLIRKSNRFLNAVFVSNKDVTNMSCK